MFHRPESQKTIDKLDIHYQPGFDLLQLRVYLGQKTKGLNNRKDRLPLET